MGAQHTDTDTYTYTAARAVEASDLSPPRKSRASAITPVKMPRPSLVFSLLTLGSLLLLTIDASPVFVDNPSLAQFQSGRNIRHLPCIVRKSGRSGVCMFAIDCIKQNGTHLGTCIDRFYFGSCCAMKEEASLFAPEINDNSIDQNTISHFAHESTTLPTSALFKLTTESSLSSSSSSSSGGASSTTHQHTTNELLKNVTQSYLSTAKPAPVHTTSNITLSTTRRPPLAHTTHKNSHFVVRTTLKPNVVPTTTFAPTIKPPRRRTTSAKPVLTTAPIVEQRIETTSVPTKFVTFQIVETTTPPVTEPTRQQETTTTTTRRHTRPTGSSSVASRTTSKTTTTSTTTTTTEAPPTTTTTKAPTTTQRPTPPLRTTTVKPHKTHSSRRPAPAKKPVGTTTTTVNGTQSTRKPVDSLASSSTTFNATTATTLPARRPVIHMSSSSSTSSSSSSSTASTTSSASTTTGLRDELTKNRTTTRLPERTTQAPRPKPKPTGEIVKVPALLAEPTTTTVTADSSSSSSSSPSSSTTPLVTKKKPTTTTAAPTTTSTTTTTTTTTTPKPTRRSTTTKAPTTTTTKATTTTTTTTTKAPTTPTTTTTTTAKPLLTTEAPTSAPLTTTTKKTGLITWTDVEAEPPTNANISNDWQPAPPPNWMPLATETPEAANKTSATTAPPSATDKVVISVATSVSEVETHGPGKPQRTTKPPKTTSTARPTTTTTTTAATTTAAATTTVKTTEAPASSIELASSTSSYTDLSSEEASSSSSSSSISTSTSTTSSPTTTAETTDYSGEEPNTTTIEATGSTTVAPANALEGVDYKEVCGRRMFPEPRIVGGANAAFGRWPWQISLRQWRTSTYLHKCGAALLNENWAITAAHCVDNVPPSDLLLRLGEYDLAEEEEPYGYQERRVQIVASHPQFDPRTFEYDLALLRFYEPVVFQPNIIPVCVPDNDENFIGQTAFVTGWGRLYEDGPLPSVLQEVAVPVINNTICESMYRSAGYIEHIPHIFICAGWKKGGYDSCEGDSGGPMVLQREADKRFQLGGVISWGIGCAEANQPGVYTRISEFRDWINQILQF
ncbi:serine proteinase stubble isoform X2 [Drosophila suzukii]